MAIESTEIYKRHQRTLITHNAVNILASSSSISAYKNCDGFDKIIVTVKSDFGHTGRISLQWSHDGLSMHVYETKTIPNISYGEFAHDVKAKYLRVVVYNDATDLPHTMSAWLFQKT